MLARSKHKSLDAKTKGSNPIPVLETTIHNAIADYLNTVIKSPSRWHTVEVSNGQSGKAGMIKQRMLKRRGVVTGWPDICIYWRTREGDLRLVFLEVKIPGGSLSEPQIILHTKLREENHNVFIVHSVDEVKAILKDLGVI